ncbi:hypothetical protein PGTUg99_033347 [Puccinia graminis f. sp. tritici]|uniref:Uncharacterized protein n=1 Tax=Puccinia graminis f. sp. tritici TaxID=56615 RepID=A0A5B0Q9F4_PUCGR|nr:hypothetical protein PGTUg99_033347 [Puccinia graminis f. sp. tritici]
MELDGMAGTHIRVLSNLRSFYVSKYITRFRAVHPQIPLPNWIVTLASPGDLRPSDTQVRVTNMRADLDGETNRPPSPQQGNVISNEQEAMDAPEMTDIRPPQEDVVPVQGPDTTKDAIHHDKEMDLTSSDAEGEVDPEISFDVGNGHVAQSGKTKGATDGSNTEGTNMDKPLFLPESNPPSEDDSPLWGSNPKVGKSNRSCSPLSSPPSASLSEPDNPQPSPPAPKNPPLGLGNVVTLGQKRPITRSLTGDATRKHRPRLDSPSLASSDSDDSSSESEEEESQGGKSDLTHPPPLPTFGHIRQPRDQTPADSDEVDTDGPNSPKPLPKTAVVTTPNPTPATTPLVPAPTSSNTVNAGAPNHRPAGTGTTLGGGGPDLTAHTTSTGPTAPTEGMTPTGPSRGPNSPPLNSPTTNSGGTPGTAAKHPTPGTLGTDPTSRQVPLREPSPDLFVRLPVGDLKCLEYWEQHKESRVDPVKTARFIEKTQCIIGLLPGLLGYKSPARPAIESPMLKNVNLVMDRCKRDNVLLGHDRDCFIGVEFVNRACLGPRKKPGQSSSMSLRSEHPLFPIINSTADPVRGAWKRLNDTIHDIIMLLACQRANMVMDDLKDVDGHSDAALAKVMEFFHDITTRGADDPKPSRSRVPDGSGDLSSTGMGHIYTNIALAVTALINLHFDKKSQEKPVILKKDTHEKMNRTSTKAIRSLSHLLVFGPVSMFSCPTDRKYSSQWQSCMLVEWGAMVVTERAQNAANFPEPPWSNFGNTRLHIINALSRMGFGNNEPMDWKHVMKVFEEDFSTKKLAEVLWEDIVLMTDYDVQKGATVFWADGPPYQVQQS